MKQKITQILAIPLLNLIIFDTQSLADTYYTNQNPTTSNYSQPQENPHYNPNSNISNCIQCHNVHGHPVNISYKTKKNNIKPNLPLDNEKITCTTCHNPYKTNMQYYLQKEQTQLCEDCHINYF